MAPIVECVLTVGTGLPTLLIYDLYDVQPTAGQPGWSVPPFDAALLTDPAGRCRLVGRGALPCNLRFLIEGEEEIGSPGLAAHIARHRDELATCDAAFIPYFGTDAAGATILRLGFKGLVLLEFRVAGGDWGGRRGETGGMTRTRTELNQATKLSNRWGPPQAGAFTFANKTADLEAFSGAYDGAGEEIRTLDPQIGNAGVDGSASFRGVPQVGEKSR